MPQFIKTIFNDLNRTLLFILVSLLVVCPLSILLIVVPLWENNRGEMGDGVLMAAGTLWMVIFLGGIYILIHVTLRRRKLWLDSVFLLWD